MKNKILLVILALYLGLFAVIPAGGTVEAAAYPGNSSEFYQWLRESGVPEYSISGTYRANYSTYREYDLIVYGSSSNVPGNETKSGESRYLGFTYMEGKYTNLAFPNDETGSNKPEDWNYVTVDGASESWDSLEQSIQRPYMLYTKLFGHGASGLTASDIGTLKAKVQGAASWKSSGSIYTYKSNGFYATFSVPSMGGGSLSAAMNPQSSVITVNSGDSDFNAGFSLTASVNKPKGEVKFIQVVFHCEKGDVVRFFHNTNSISIQQDSVFSTPVNLPGSKSLSATVTSESIFGDKLQKTVSCTVSVKDNSSPGNTNPGPVVTPPPNTGGTSGGGNPGTTNPGVGNTPGGDGNTGGDGNNGGSGNNGGGNEDQDDDEEDKPVIPFKIIRINLTGAWHHWADRHRFLSLEKVYIRIFAVGTADRAVIRFSPALEAMTYTNSKGHTYDYADDFFGEYINFPGDSTVAPSMQNKISTTFAWEYAIPMCDETMGWDGNRKLPPYNMTVTVYGKDGYSESYTVDDIEITGNIYELLYPQPAD